VNETLPALRALLTELVALDTTSVRPNQPLIDYAQAKLEAAGFEAERLGYRDEQGVEKVNLVAVKGGSEERWWGTRTACRMTRGGRRRCG
jgi:acetylornithine deacetylase